jgi:predicted transcriptional regulator
MNTYLRGEEIMDIKLFDSELKVMDVIWSSGDLTAKRIAEILRSSIGWNKNTTYTVIKKCVEKGAIERKEPDFICHALISREQAQEFELDELIGKMFGGSADLLFASLLNRQKLPADVLEKLKGAAGGDA